MKKLLFLSIMITMTCKVFAADIDSGVSAMDDTSGFIAAYLPVIRDSLFIFAGIIALVGIILVSYQMQVAPEKARRLMLGIGGSCAFVTIFAVTLPMFFGYDEQGVFAYAGGGTSGGGASTGGSGSGGSSSGTGGTGGSGSGDYIGQPINTDIPELDNPIWTPKPNSSAYTQDWMEKNDIHSYEEIIDNAIAAAFYSGNSQGERGLSNYGSDVEYLLRRYDGDWNKAIQQADNDIAWAYQAESNGDPLPYSHRDYETIYEGLLAAYKYTHGYDYSS